MVRLEPVCVYRLGLSSDGFRFVADRSANATLHLVFSTEKICLGWYWRHDTLHQFDYTSMVCSCRSMKQYICRLILYHLFLPFFSPLTFPSFSTHSIALRHSFPWLSAWYLSWMRPDSGVLGVGFIHWLSILERHRFYNRLPNDPHIYSAVLRLLPLSMMHL